jgi:hypothetical protein
METGVIKHFIDILLDQPGKAEKIFLWTLQALITLWGFSLVGFDIVSIVKNGESSLLNTTTNIILFTIVWSVAWGGLIDLLVVTLFYLLNPIIRFIRKAPVYLIRLIFFKLKLTKKPKFVWKQQINHFPVDYTELMSLLDGVKIIDRVTRSSNGSTNMLKILSYNKKQFIKTRIIRYYSILLIVTIANIVVYKLNTGSIWGIAILLITLFFLGKTIFDLIDLYDRIDSKYMHYLKPVIEFEIYKDFIYYSLLKAPLLFDNYSIKIERNTVILTFKDKETIYENPYKEIYFIPTNAENYSQQLTKMKESQPNVLVVFLSKNNLPLYDLNKIAEAEHCFIQTTDESQLVEAVKTLRPIFLGKLKPIADNPKEKE